MSCYDVLPGQYFDAETGLHYNYYRDYDPGTGRYIESDPVGIRAGLNTYIYAASSPVERTDPFGLVAQFCCRYLSSYLAGQVFGQRHCFIKSGGGIKYELFARLQNNAVLGIPESPTAIDATNNPGGECHDCPAKHCQNQEECLRKATAAYAIGIYHILGPNSNTFAASLANSCCEGGVPKGVHDAPGLASVLPVPYSRPKQYPWER